ncbi:peptide chain release factor 3 [Priestia endophytica]|uniref:Peptide chain release factor 3 n=1 Tax=Priestia endophytica DSM 13796 TaxID=1121089 RepID=A0A1I6C4X2_9BACI|nr:peptide chain release factor 3 [Priestia endophytica]KYG30845.1 peptide chain release factor 3 [Priestia endophytica]MBG9811417.1 peptide chain release factor 3 [Priestia endophytica]SFQ88241.1 bacterial peptide chain release factor 3 (bRF-3) [Priestia endophytica DSM 13796]
MSIQQEQVESRRTFAIISHPDAGKTTLTEKLLLLGGMIRSAGTVKGKKSGKFATSDWMEIEKQRGISVTSSVMQFSYRDHFINILDTPGHEDFSEDTYRTLTAVDSAVMVIDGTKGIEAQTLKLFKVCRMRGIPILTFINKLDREGKDPLELLEEIEEVLEIESYPATWPIGMGKAFQGTYDRFTKQVEVYRGNEESVFIPFDGKTVTKELEEHVRSEYLPGLIDEISLLEEAGNEFNLEKVKRGELTPVFFGSAIANFGVQSFFNSFLPLTLPPQPRHASKGEVSPLDDSFSGFIFKIQANMNPAHRDRIAFVRVCSGVFERGMTVTLPRTGRSMKLAQSHQFLASSRETVDKAFPGDIIGIYDSGNYQIGDTIIGGNETFEFDELPKFPPEMFRKVRVKNAMKHKHFEKGLTQLVQEGAVQLYKTPFFQDYILGAVGELQFQVFEHRMKGEYGVDLEFQYMNHHIARWIPKEQIQDRMLDSRVLHVLDRDGHSVLLFENDFVFRLFQDKYPDVTLTTSFEKKKESE